MIGGPGDGAFAGLPAPAPQGVRENRIGLIDQLEAFFGNGIVAVEIGMPAAGLLTKRLFEQGSIGAGGEIEHLPVINGDGHQQSAVTSRHSGAIVPGILGARGTAADFWARFLVISIPVAAGKVTAGCQGFAEVQVPLISIPRVSTPWI